MYQHLIQRELNQAAYLLQSFIDDQSCLQSIEDAAKLIANTFKSGGKVIVCGNGGSHCDAMHFSEELIGRYRNNRSGYPAIAISDPSVISCVSNDLGYEQVFSRYVEAVGNYGDILVGISTSGNSANVAHAIEVAHVKNMRVIFLTGKKSEQVKNSADIQIYVNHSGYSDRIQEIHIKIIHILTFLIEKEMAHCYEMDD